MKERERVIKFLVSYFRNSFYLKNKEMINPENFQMEKCVFIGDTFLASCEMYGIGTSSIMKVSPKMLDLVTNVTGVGYAWSQEIIIDWIIEMEKLTEEIKINELYLQAVNKIENDYPQ